MYPNPFPLCREWAEWDIHYVKLGSGGGVGVEGEGGGSTGGGSSGSGGGGSSGEVVLGNDAPPTAAMQASFTALVTECLTKDPKGVVLVIDEYGYNRSGALIVRHLVEACGVAPGDALAALGKCRAPGLYSPAALAWAVGSLGPHVATGFTPGELAACLTRVGVWVCVRGMAQLSPGPHCRLLRAPRTAA